MNQLNFKRLLSTYWNFFLITPWMDCDINSSRKLQLSKIYGSVLIIAKTIWIVFMVTDDTYKFMLSTQSLAEHVLYIVTSVENEVLTLLIILKSTFCDIDKWKTLLQSLRLIDRELQHFGHRKRKFWIKMFCVFFAKQIIFLGLCFHLMHYWARILRRTLLDSFFLLAICNNYCHFLVITFLTCMIEDFGTKYKELNKRFVLASKSTDLRQKLKKLTLVYQVLGESVEVFNRLFGYHIVLITFNCLLGLVLASNSLFMMLTVYKHYPILLYVSMSNIFLISFFAANFMMIPLSVSAAVAEARRFVKLSYRFQDRFHEEAKELEDLRKMGKCSMHFVPEFNAAGCFSVKKSLILILVSKVASYFIIVEQLNESKYKHS